MTGVLTPGVGTEVDTTPEQAEKIRAAMLHDKNINR